MQRVPWRRQEVVCGRPDARGSVFCLGVASFLELVCVTEGIHPQDPVNEQVSVSGSCGLSATSATAGDVRDMVPVCNPTCRIHTQSDLHMCNKLSSERNTSGRTEC